MKEKILYQIACIIDNEYTSKEKTFTAKRLKEGCWYLSTNKCDFASFIKVFESENIITEIKRNGPDTESWKEILPQTREKIAKYIQSLDDKRPILQCLHRYTERNEFVCKWHCLDCGAYID